VSNSKLSVQLYTVRELLAQDLPGTLQRLADIGFTQVEPYAFQSFGPALGAALEAAGLAAPTTHQHYIGEDDSFVASVFADARTLGIGTVIDPHVPAERWQTREDIEKTAAQLNAAATLAADAGVVVGYHNHAHELVSTIDGTTGLEIFAGALDDGVVLEVDTYWVAVAGLDPIEVLGRLGDRVAAIHVKDGPGTKDTLDQVAVGHGSLDIRGIIDAAPQALRVVELDDSRGDRFQAVADSFTFLTSEGLA
jgi:sugar phosphate isomerase/epimerase